MGEFNLTELRNTCLASLYGCTDNIAKYLENDIQRDVEYKKLRKCVMEYCKMEKLEQAGKKAMESLQEESDFLDWDTVKAQYESKLANCIDKQRLNFDKHSYMRELEKHIKTVEAGREQNAEQSDVAITETRETYRDPLSLKLINNPMRNKICSHVYDKESIERHIKNRKNKGCPVVGCTNNQVMLEYHLELDDELLLTIQRTQQRTEMEVEEYDSQ